MAINKYYISLLVNTILLISLAGDINSVLVGTRLRSGLPPEPLLNASMPVHEDRPPYQLTINEGTCFETSAHSEAAITLNLNRPIADQDLNVNVTIYSRPDIIQFEASKDFSYIITYKANQFGDRLIKFKTTHQAGHAEIVCKVESQPKDITIDDSSAYVSVDVNRNWNLKILIQLFGWIYFFAWSASFYPQVFLNYRRQSVVGLNFDFLALNLLGFTCYSIYNLSLLFSHSVQRDYYARYTYSRIPVEYNDLFFSIHAFALSLVTVIQCFKYERGEQKVSLYAIIFVAVSMAVGLGFYITNLFDAVTLLTVIFYLSYVKLVITVIKYIPQAYMNYQRKATTGWSIHNILLDSTGGIFSIMQMFVISYNYDDWTSIFGNFTKFGLGVISISFDVLFVVQHYCLYKQPFDNLEGSSDSIPSPVISQSIRSTSYVPPAPPALVVADDGQQSNSELEQEN